MSTIYILEQGASLRKDGQQLRVVLPSGEDLLSLPLEQVEQVLIVGHATLTAPAAQALLERCIPVTYLTTTGRILGRLQPFENKNVPLRWAQFQAAAALERTVAIARAIVKGKVFNQRCFLMRAEREGVSGLEEAIDRLKALVKKADQVKSLEEVRGIEGAAAAEYFRQWPRLIRALGFPFPGRIKRPATDPVNALLSFGYTLLLNEVTRACCVVGFDPYLGYLHMDRYGRPALALDLMEEFRPILVDSLVLAVINREMIGPEDFEGELGGAKRLRRPALKKFLQAWEQKRRTMVQHPGFGIQVPYWRVVELQARVLAKVLLGELEEYVPFLDR